MDLTGKPQMVFAGPLASRAVFMAQLRQQRFELDDRTDGHGLPDTAEGTEDKTVGWVTVGGEDVDAVQDIGAHFGYVLRMHQSAPFDISPPVDDTPALSEADVRRIIRDEMRRR